MKLRILTHLVAIAFGAALMHALAGYREETSSSSTGFSSAQRTRNGRFVGDDGPAEAALPHRVSERPASASSAVVKVPRDLADLGIERKLLEIVEVKDGLIEAKPVDGGEVMQLDPQLKNPTDPVVIGSKVWCLTASAGENREIPAGARFLASSFDWENSELQTTCNSAPSPQVREGAKLVIRMSAYDHVDPVMSEIPYIGRLFQNKLEQPQGDAGQ